MKHATFFTASAAPAASDDTAAQDPEAELEKELAKLTPEQRAEFEAMANRLCDEAGLTLDPDEIALEKAQLAEHRRLAPKRAAALRHLEDIARSPGKRRAYDAASDGERRDITNLNAAKREGLAEGLAKGAAAAKLETARKMKADGLPPDAIARYTGLSPEQLQDL
ncbi:MAG: hypothetical protein LBR07_10755 [Puniceicoccales bacterium]|jgi:hypothetical protein|nr:hypothetical protein [Puniceicoccales bacterium]